MSTRKPRGEGPRRFATPFVVAHRHGNDLDLLQRAESLGAALVEADVHLFRGALEVRHLKTVGPIPLLWDRWRLGNPFAPRLLLPELLGATAPATELMLDLKGLRADVGRRVLDALHPHLAARRITVCSRNWRALEAFTGNPRVRVIHSVGSARQLRALRDRFVGRRLQGVSIHARLLDPQVVQDLRQLADLVMSWPVQTLGLARQLADWGIDGLISERLDLADELDVGVAAG